MFTKTIQRCFQIRSLSGQMIRKLPCQISKSGDPTQLENYWGISFKSSKKKNRNTVYRFFRDLMTTWVD